LLTTLLLPSLSSLLLLSTTIALLSAALGVWLTSAPQGSRGLVPFSAGLLVGIAAFGVWPELAGHFGWTGGLALLVFGFALLWFVNRYVYAVCPSCAHTHDHSACSIPLHGFALPLVAAAALHSLMDGWGIAASHQGSGSLGLSVFLGVALHKIPEGVAYGAILRAALGSRSMAFGWCVIAQAPTLAGGVMESLVAPYGGIHWVGVPIAMAGGSFLYLGFHAVHNEWRRRGMIQAFAPALTGAAGAAALQQGLRVLLR
jgi:zinc transporter ZupT